MSTYKLQQESVALEMNAVAVNEEKKPREKGKMTNRGGCRKEEPRPMEKGVDYVNAMEDDQMEVFGYQPDGRRALATWCGVLLTAGFLRLLFYWYPAWWLYCTHRRCPLQQATQVLLMDQYKQLFVEKLRSMHHSSVKVPFTLKASAKGDSQLHEANKLGELVTVNMGGALQPTECLVYFENKKIRYIWDPEVKAFSRLRGLDGNVPCSYFHQQNGLSLKEQVVRFLNPL